MVAVVENGRITGLEPDPGNRATRISVCLKGISHIERVYSKDRILNPLLRQKNSKGREFLPITWDQAIEMICEQLVRHKEEYGSQSIFYYTASGQKGLLNEVGMNFFKLFGGCTTKYGDLCWQAGLEATRLTLGANKHNAPWDLKHADLILLWGKNPAETNVQQMQFIYDALENGARFVVIDPRRTQSGERASRVLQIKPGTDGALALGLANILIQNHWINPSFIETHVLGFEDFKQYASGFTPEKTADLTGIPRDEIIETAGLIARAKAMSICCGFGLQRFTNSGQSLRAIIALSAITGHIGRPGAGWVYSNLQSAVFDAVPSPQSAYPPESPHGPVRFAVSTARLGDDMAAVHDPSLKMAVISRANPVSQNPDTSRTLKALRALNFIVTFEHFMTDTARVSDLVLPAASMFEQTDLTTGYWHPYIQIRQKVIESPENVRPESQVYYQIARKLGYSDDQLAGKIPGPEDTDIEEFLSSKLRPFPGLSLNRLKKGPVLAPGHQDIAFRDFNFPTPSGKIELVSQQAKDRWGVPVLPEYSPSEEAMAEKDGKTDSTYPFYLLTPNTKNRIHSQFNNLSGICRFSPEPRVYIHPVDAEDRHIFEGDRVRVFNDRGRIRIKARLDFSIRRGCICIPNGWWVSQGGGVNLCSKGRETDMGHGAAFHDNRVQVEK